LKSCDCGCNDIYDCNLDYNLDGNPDGNQDGNQDGNPDGGLDGGKVGLFVHLQFGGNSSSHCKLGHSDGQVTVIELVILKEELHLATFSNLSFLLLKNK
jgi:hypothetical protein